VASAGATSIFEPFLSVNIYDGVPFAPGFPRVFQRK
jgi:hypothetical protein